VRHLIESTKERFSPDDTLEKCLDLTFKCYRAASMDLYVVGFPSIVLVKDGGVANLAERCASLWESAEAGYFNGLRAAVLDVS